MNMETKRLDTFGAGRYRDASELTGEKPTRPFAEIRIPVPWGHIAGKWYGPQNIRPILGMHGWLDSAGTYDTLVPLLHPEVAFLSIDLPGHGLSSRLPNGCYYNLLDFVYVIRMIMNQYKWKKVSLIGHSMSGIIGFLFASIFPDLTEMVISIDALKPHQRRVEDIVDSIAKRFESFLIEDERISTNIEPPSYTYDEIIEKQYIGSLTFADKDKCKYILARNIQQSKENPNQYFYCRDRRVMFYNYKAATHEMTLEMAKRITAPHMFIKAQNSIYFEEKKYYFEVLDILLQKKNFEYVEVKGTHHVHLNNPEVFINKLNEFIRLYGPKPEVLSKL